MAPDPEHDRRDPATQTRRQDVVSRTRLDDIHDDYVKWGNRSLKVLGILTVILFAFAIADVYLWQHIDANTERNKANAEAIQDSRASAELTRCQEANQNHDTAINRLNAIIDKAIGEKKIDAAMGASAKVQNKIIIDALVPKQDCAVRVKQLTGETVDG